MFFVYFFPVFFFFFVLFSFYGFLSDEVPTLETLEFAFYIGSTPTFLHFDLYLNTAYTRSTLHSFIFLF